MPTDKDHIARILVVDDDVLLAQEVATFLSDEGFDVQTAHDAGEARRLLHAEDFDLFVLDIIMPGTSGKVLCREIAQSSKAGVIVVSSLEDDEERIALLEMGADDYLIKPFNMRELLARVHAFLRRAGSETKTPRLSEFGQWRFGKGERQLIHTGDGRVVSLTPSEVQVLRYLAANPDIVFSREDLLAVARVRQHSGGNDRSVDNLIKRLRRKIEADPASPTLIETVWGKGYVFRPN